MTDQCPLCAAQNEKVIVKNALFRVIRVADDCFPGYFRVIWNAHVKENSDLSEAERSVLWHALNEIERILIEEMKPEKINLAEFGTQVPHLHWHLIPRFKDDAKYPDSYWSAPVRVTDAARLRQREEAAARCERRICSLFA